MAPGTKENALKELNDVKENIKKLQRPSDEKINHLTPSNHWKMMKYYNGNMTKIVKSTFLKHLDMLSVSEEAFQSREADVKQVATMEKLTDQFTKIMINFNGKFGPSDTKGHVKIGNEWHKILKDAIQDPQRNEESVASVVIKKVRDIFGIEILVSEFALKGYMCKTAYDLRFPTYFWEGSADAIGWYKNKKVEPERYEYVIIDWKTYPDLPKFWEKTEACGKYLHQCLAYAKLLQMNMGWNYLPSTLLVPISSKNGKEMQPGHFVEYPKECTDMIDENYSWSGTELPKLWLELSGKVSLFSKKIKELLQESGEVKNEDTPLHSIFSKKATVKDLLSGLDMSDKSLKIVLEE